MDSAVDLTAFRNPERADRILKRLKNEITRPWVIMEMCGGQTHALMQSGIDQLLASQIEFIHGPGCPVCVTSLALVDEAIALAKLPNVILTTYGDMLRVPGSAGNLFAA
ncbi:MAG TPA: hydrogenase formation protein HypD, partial [Flexilinea sp.]|nr:hydrogenase formation protein HypD [Flexilinea sp.]